MFRECQNCRHSMSAQADGWICTHCGQIERPDDNPQPLEPSRPIGYDPIPEPRHPEIPFTPVVPIINHHASSYYKQHLQERLAQLDIPELPAPDVSPPLESHYASSSAVESRAHRTPERVITPPSPLEATTLTTPQEDTLVPDTPTAATPAESTKPDRPYRPSAYVVHATTPLTQQEKSSRQTHHTSTSEEALLNQAIRDSLAANRIPTGSPHTKADELLAAAATPAKTNPPSHRTWILLAASIVLLIAGGTGAWLLLKPPSSSTSSTVTSPTPQTSNPLLTTPKEPSKRDAQRKSDLNSIAIGLEAYHKSTGAYPVGSDISILASLEKTTPPFITHINLDPSSTSGTEIKYSYSSDGSSFTLSAILENPLDADAKDGLYIVRNK